MAFNKKLLLTTSFIAGLAMIVPTAVMAQDAPASTQDPDGEDQSSESDVEAIIVTGSRIRRNEYTSTQPVQIITSEEATLEGLVDTSEILQQSTVAANSVQINNYFTGYIGLGNDLFAPGSNNLSLRGLGAQRTLVLLNGRRAGPAGARGVVGPTDLNVIPSSLIERVEILTDGASSIYGSDAVAGVVNIITAQNRDGGNVDAYYSQPFDDAGEEFNISGSYGWTFDKGYLSIGADYYERQPVLFGDRQFFECPQNFIYSDPELLLRADLVDPDTGDYLCNSMGANMATVYDAVFIGGVFAGVGTTDYAPDPNAVNGGGPMGCDVDGWRQILMFTTGYLGCRPATNSQNYRDMVARAPSHNDRYASRTAVSPVKRMSFSAFAGYDLDSNTEIFGELLLNRRESSQDSFRQIWGVVPTTNPNWDLGALFPNALFFEPTIMVDSQADQTVDYARAVAGIRGSLDIGTGWDWELAAQYSRSEAEYGALFVYDDRFNAALGDDGCDETLLTTATACPAGGIDFFDPNTIVNGAFTDAERDFLFGYETGNTVYEHKYIEGLITGELFNLPAGPVGAALGFQIREESMNDLPGEQERNGNYWGSSSAVQTKGEDTIKEVFAEFEIPLLRDKPLFESLSVNLSGRLSDYDSYGENSTYKVGLNWALTPEWRIRASEGTSFRAPALYELYLGNLTSFLPQTSVDPCLNWGLSSNPDIQANCAAEGVPPDMNATGSSSATIFTGGGIGNLNPETAESQSVGVIWTPSFIDLSVALDYFKVEIIDQVQKFGAGAIVAGCYNSENYPDEPLCDLFTRSGDTGNPNTAFRITEVQDNYVNIARQESEGLDLNARYSREFGVGDLTLNGRVSYILNWESQLRTASTATQLNDRIGYPDWVASASARFDRGDWTFFWNMDFVPESSNDRLFASNQGTYLGQTVYFDRTVEAYQNHSFSVRKQADDWTFQVGIRNVFDHYPNPTSSSGGGRGAGNIPLASQYDYLGRRAFINISRRF